MVDNTSTFTRGTNNLKRSLVLGYDVLVFSKYATVFGWEGFLPKFAFDLKLSTFMFFSKLEKIEIMKGCVCYWQIIRA